MTEEISNTQIREKVLATLKGLSPQAAIPALFQMENSLPEHLRSLVREPMLYVFENQHDWDNIIKCLRFWGGLYTWTRGFYDRMKKRLSETPEKNLADHELMSEVVKLVNKYQAKFEKAKPLILNIEKYLKKDEDDKKSNTNKSGKSITSIQSMKSIHSVKSNPVPQPKTSADSVQPPKSLQNGLQQKNIQIPQFPNTVQSVQTLKNTNSESSSILSQSIKPIQTVQSNPTASNQPQPTKMTGPIQSLNSASNPQSFRRTEVPKMPRISRMTEHIDDSKSNSKSNGNSRQTKTMNMRKPPNIPVFKKDGSNSSSDAPNKNQKRLTFGISDQLRGNLKLMTKPVGEDAAKKNQIHEQKLDIKVEEKVQNEQQKNIGNQENKNQINESQVEKSENIFERKEEAAPPVRVNPIMVTGKKDLNQNQQKPNQSKSFSKSITPNKPLVERKKLVIKKVNDFKPSAPESMLDDEGDIHPSSFEDDFFDERTTGKQSVQIQEVQELKKEIKNASEAGSAQKTKLNPEKQLEKSGKQKKRETTQQSIKKHAQISHAAMTRRDDQLFSDYEVSLMCFNPNENSNEVNLYNIMQNLNLTTLKDHTQQLKNELEQMRKTRATRVRRHHL